MKKNVSKQAVTPVPPTKSSPSDGWTHKDLWLGVQSALKALPAYFHSDTFIEGVDATDVFTLSGALGATIETQVVATLNRIRNVWDKNGRYSTYTFVRQSQTFPDVILRNLADESEPPIMGIELKGWYLLAKEAEPSLRFTQSERACADADLIMVVPWVLSSVISGRPRIYAPYIEGAKYIARYRNYHWQFLKRGKDNRIIFPENAAPYPKKSDPTTDQPVSDVGKNFGRIARSGIMNEYLSVMLAQPVCGIRARHWLEFFKLFQENATDEAISAGLERLRGQINVMAPSPTKESVLAIVASLEQHLGFL